MIVLSMSVTCIQVSCAEVKITNFMVKHNLPLAVSDHLTPLVGDMFSDSAIAKKYACHRTKATSILNFAIALHFRGMWFVCSIDSKVLHLILHACCVYVSI